jgi:hypothetical protein
MFIRNYILSIDEKKLKKTLFSFTKYANNKTIKVIFARNLETSLSLHFTAKKH